MLPIIGFELGVIEAGRYSLLTAFVVLGCLVYRLAVAVCRAFAYVLSTEDTYHLLFATCWVHEDVQTAITLSS